MNSPNETNNFIVKLDERYFFLCFGENGFDVRGTKVLSEAEHLDYRSADVLVQDLRSRGYESIVVNRYGVPVTAEILQQVDSPQLPAAPAEFYSIPKQVLKRRYFSEPA